MSRNTPESKARNAKNYRKKFRDYKDAVKIAIGCEECGYHKHPAALQFDHINPETKSFPVSHGMNYSWDKFLAEIAKCRVLCANCHMIYTHS